MRISDDRYSRDRLRLDLALRFIHHEARTHTIRAWTGLTDDRIRKLYRTYLCEAGGTRVARHRGKSPRQAAFFTRCLRMRREAAVFASVSSLFGLITPQSITRRPRHAAGAHGGARCPALRGLRDLPRAGDEPQISFEHAVFLIGALDSGDELRVAHCRDCAGVLVTDRLALRPPVCNECAGARHSAVGRRRRGLRLGRRIPAAAGGRFARVSIRPTLFSGQFLDRRAELRDDPRWVLAARSDPATRYVLGAGAAQLVTGGGSIEIAFLTGDDPLVARPPRRGPHLVRLVPRRALRAGRNARTVLRQPRTARRHRAQGAAAARAAVAGRFRLAARLCARTGAVEGAASLLRRLRCANLPARAGHVMRCSRESCGNETFPRLDPAIIVLVTDASGERALLGRQASWPAGPILDHRRLRRARRKSRGRGGARGGRGNRRAGGGGRIRLLAAMAVSVLADAGISRRGAAPMPSRCATASWRTRAGSRVPTWRPVIRRCPRPARSPRASSTAGSTARRARCGAGSRRCVC